MGAVTTEIKGSLPRIASIKAEGLITNYVTGQEDAATDMVAQCYKLTPDHPGAFHVGYSLDLVPRLHWAVNKNSPIDVDVHALTDAVPIAFEGPLTIECFIRANGQTFRPRKSDVFTTQQDPVEPEYYHKVHVLSTFSLPGFNKAVVPTFNFVAYLKDAPTQLLGLAVFYSVRSYRPFLQHRDIMDIVDSFTGVELDLLFS